MGRGKRKRLLQHRQIKAVIFDLDDTLISWSEPTVEWDVFHLGRVEQTRNYLTEKGYALPEAKEFHAFIHQRLRQVWDDARQEWIIPNMGEVMRQILVDLSVSTEQVDMEAVLTHYNWGVFPGVVPFDDTHKVLKWLRQEQYKIGLVTNSIFPMWMRDVELEAYNIIDYLDARITSGDIGYLKPHPEIYERILEMLDVKAAEAVFVGDRPQNDIAGANEVGLISVLISPPHLERELDGVVPDHTITSLSQLLPILEELS
jgi:FMN phosphatase YigB (HAD superfamily)